MNCSRRTFWNPAQGAESGDGGNRTHATFPAAKAGLFRSWRVAALITLTAVCLWLLIVFGTIRVAEARCRSTACWQRVHDARAERWCKRHESCRWRHEFARRPMAWRRWAWSTASCESNLRFHIATGNGYYGGLQFSASTAWAAGFTRLPHLTTQWEQLVRAIDFARRHGVQHWPVCGR